MHFYYCFSFPRMPIPGEEVILSYLPYCQVAAQIIDIYYAISVAATLVFSSSNVIQDSDSFFRAILDVKPTILCGPPRMFEKLYYRLIDITYTDSALQRFLLGMA